MSRRFFVVLGSVAAAAVGVWLLGAGLPGAVSPAPSASVRIADGADGVSGAGARAEAAGRVPDALPLAGALPALRTALAVDPPYEERGRSAGGDWAIGYRVSVRAGDTLRVVVDRPDIRLHAFRIDNAGRGDPDPIAAGRGDGVLELAASMNGDVAVLLHGGSPRAVFTSRIERSGGLVFPVASRGPEDVIGDFLDPRDGGRRVHHGVDISALPGTPVRAVADGIIERVETTPAGGLTIRLIEARTGHVHYYAHLAAAFVEAGQRVAAGKTIGGVGNTGNARNTPPHLHYGVFDGDVILDPMKLLAPDREGFRDPEPSPLLGAEAVTTAPGAALRAAPTTIGPARSLELGQPVRVLAETGRHYRVHVPGIGEGYLARWLVGPRQRSPR